MSEANSPPDLGGSEAHSPSFEQGCTLDRRRFMQATAGSAAAIATAGTVGAVDGEDVVLAYALTNPLTAPFVAGALVADWSGDVDESPTSDEVILHSMAVSERESYNAHAAVFGNHLQDTPAAASLEARHEIASAWEDGKNSTEGYAAAQSGVRDYYGTHEINHIEVFTKAFTQFSFIAKTCEDDPDIFDDFLSIEVTNATLSGTDDSMVMNRVTSTRVEETYSLKNGEEHTVTTPEFLFETEQTEHREPLTQAVIDSYDPETKTFTFSDDSGNSWETPLTLVVQNVGEELPSETVFDGRSWAELLDDVRAQSDNVTANYSESFVTDLYAELDAGNISPSDIRGVEAQAQYLSGTDDVTADRFRMALLQALKMEQPDLSSVASMLVSYDGFTGREASTNSAGDRQMFSTEAVTDEQYEGLLYGSGLPDDGLQTGGRYTVGLPVYYGDADYEVHSVNSASGTPNWSYDAHSGILFDLAVSPDGATVYTAAGDSESHAVDVTNGARLWSVTNSNGDVRAATADPDGDTLFLGGDGGFLEAVHVADGTTKWSASTTVNRVSAIELSPDGGTIFVSDGSTVRAISTSDGSENWTYSGHAETVSALAVSPDGETLYTGSYDTDVHAVAVSDQSQKWTLTDHPDTVSGLGVSPDGETLYSSSETVIALNVADQSTGWTFDSFGRSNGLETSNDGNLVYVTTWADTAESAVFAFDSSDGSIEWTAADGKNSANGLAIRQIDGSLDGSLARALMYDAPSGSEIQMSDGVIEMESMTNRDGEEQENVNWDEPEYDTYDSKEFVTYIETVEEYLESLEAEEGSDGDDSLFPGFGFDSGGGWAGLAIIGVLVLFILNGVSDILPGK